MKLTRTYMIQILIYGDLANFGGKTQIILDHIVLYIYISYRSMVIQRQPYGEKSSYGESEKTTDDPRLHITRSSLNQVRLPIPTPKQLDKAPKFLGATSFNKQYLNVALVGDWNMGEMYGVS